jgi:hypothetical protein
VIKRCLVSLLSYWLAREYKAFKVVVGLEEEAEGRE